MTSKGKHSYKTDHGTRECQPLLLQELTELIESLRAAKPGTTILAIRKPAAK